MDALCNSGWTLRTAEDYIIAAAFVAEKMKEVAA